MQRVGDEPNIATQYIALANVYGDMGNVGRALEYYHKSLVILERIGNRHSAAVTYFNLGILYRQQGDAAQARVHYEKAKALFEMVGAIQDAQDAAQALRGCKVASTIKRALRGL
jgi:tetratricopeptide (TPR) repeat protein